MCVRRVRISEPEPPTPSGRASLLLTFSVFLVRSCVVLLDHIFRTRASPRWSTAFIFGLHSMFSIKREKFELFISIEIPSLLRIPEHRINSLTFFSVAYLREITAETVNMVCAERKRDDIAAKERLLD